ncbi:M90 family metallopeptidase [Thiohalomonas denitrificans]|uniref:Zinc-dependent peptidase n=1 Tax=Thiohalomonas denitrificans TaxID=415747 RepID=A0A1G5QAE7_9GAMM|nr:M90 family metallopeptidase [Thiohalomonas denitrificans]SCZ58249.1 hypothetical protein SAMN03097708_01645 [Thiohalomonas denitrificans]
MWSFRHWRRRRILARSAVSKGEWRRAEESLPLLESLTDDERHRLREWATLFLHEKSLEGVQGLTIDGDAARRIALQACLPILHLDFDWLRGWTSVVIYPDAFVVDHEEMDSAGVVHRVREARSGESWDRGPLIISAADVDAGRQRDAYNVILHEIAHKLDALNGVADGFPPLHGDMQPEAWTRAFTRAFEDINQRLDAGQETLLDPYAAEAPEEFFAVATETFFEVPERLAEAYPDVFEQLARFYRVWSLKRS